MILDDSKISRSTFYRCFYDKYDLMSWCYKHYADKLLAGVDNNNWEETCYIILTYIYENHEYFENAFKVQGENSFSNFLYQYLYEFHESKYMKNTNSEKISDIEKMVLKYISMGCVQTLKTWLENGRKESVVDMAKLGIRLVPAIFR